MLSSFHAVDFLFSFPYLFLLEYTFQNFFSCFTRALVKVLPQALAIFFFFFPIEPFLLKIFENMIFNIDFKT